MPTILSMLARSNAVADIHIPKRPVSSKRSFFQLVRDSINNIRKKRNRIAPVKIINVAVADGKSAERDFFSSSKTNAQVSLNPIEDQSTIRVGGYTHINEFGLIDEAIVDEFNDLCSQLRRDPTLRDTWNNIKVKPEPVTQEIREIYARRQEWSKKVLDDAIEKFRLECLDSFDEGLDN